ncbi:MAG: ABC transporter substrate-binding protein [Candidatus Moranbacteria bacterium]|jgi:phospholipid transport system substrate-binding protein|nr:ABC transporter substrate-binding protein [Candidatus Moranbacteria bacterium]
MKKLFLAGISAVFFIFFSFSSCSADSAEPMEILKEKIEAIVLILDDSTKKEDVFIIVESVFDFNEISKRALGAKWGTLSPEDQENFVHGFSRKIFEAYYEKISGKSSTSEIIFLGQRTKNGIYNVSTKIVRNQIEIPIAYRMRLSANGQWKIYDIVIGGVSLVANYRSQLNSMSSTDIMAKITKAE